ncbi:MAG: helix-turn-helix domain-containing protein [Bacteroidetes bacterium]|nr:helix-turn-helix domain-containing protein [Bacteroidota bacterium]
MKEKDGYIDCPQQQVILYVEKEDGTYTPIQTGSYITKNYLDDYELKRKHLEESLKKQVLAGEVSPVYYFMVLEELTLSELAARAGIRKGKVKKHLEPGYFKSLQQETLQAYADVFNINVQELLQLSTAPPDDPTKLNPEA